jgi:hypothetical protein
MLLRKGCLLVCYDMARAKSYTQKNPPPVER